MKKLGLLLAMSVLFIAGAAFADDKYVDCIDPDVGKSCMECAQGGPQVCCPKQGTCTVNKLGGGPISEPVACSESESQETPAPASEGSEQQS
jgi:hypothetical protein